MHKQKLSGAHKNSDLAVNGKTAGDSAGRAFDEIFLARDDFMCFLLDSPELTC